MAPAIRQRGKGDLVRIGGSAIARTTAHVPVTDAVGLC